MSATANLVVNKYSLGEIVLTKVPKFSGSEECDMGQYKLIFCTIDFWFWPLVGYDKMGKKQWNCVTMYRFLVANTQHQSNVN